MSWLTGCGKGWRVLTNEDSPIYAEVLQRVDESTFSPGMVLALAARLTAAFAIPLTENRQLAGLHGLLQGAHQGRGGDGRVAGAHPAAPAAVLARA
jgi:hypothetical protein